MQRWIALGVVMLLVMAGGGYFALKTYRQNKPGPVWVPIPINPELPVERRDEIVRELEAKLGETGRLVRVSRDVGLVSKWGLASDEEGASRIAGMMYVKEGEANTPQGIVPAIHIGVRGKVKERELSGKIVMRMMEDVREILGIEPPPE
jgi:hypothetical protein